MNRKKLMIKYLFPFLMIAGTALILSGCGGGAQKPVVQVVNEQNRDMALERYLNGQLLDQKEQYATAVLEYQDALRFFQDPAIYIALAKDYSILRKNEQAVEAANNALRIEPTNNVFRQTLAEILIQAFQFDEAATQYNLIIKQDSSNRSAWYNLARLTQISTPSKSLEICQQIIDRFGPDEDIYRQMVQIYSMRGEKGNAVGALKGLLSFDPGSIEIKKSLADLYMDMDSVDTALGIYNEILEIYPENVTIRAAIAHGFLAKHDYDKTKQLLESFLKNDSLSVDDQIEFGQVFLVFVQEDSSVIPMARKLFEGMQAQNPEDWRPYWFLGALANTTHEDSLSVKYFAKVTELADWNADGWVGVASVWYDKGEVEKAAEILEEARRHVKDDFRVEFIYGLSLQRLRRLDDAAGALERAIALNNKSVDAFSALALVYDGLQRHADSDTMYEQALKLNPKNHLVLNNYGYSLADRGIQLERAEKMIKDALAQQPDNTSYLDSMGWVFFRLGQYGDAERYIKKAIELGSNSSVIFEHLGDIYFKQNNKEKAAEYWKKAFDLDSTNKSLKEKIERGTL